MQFLKGTGVALVTPFLSDKKIDFEALTGLVDHVINGGVEYLVVMGTTAESAVLTRDEKSSVVKHIIDINQHRVPIVLGIGGNNTRAVTEEIEQHDFEGISGLLSVCPYYNKPNQNGLYAHFSAVAKSSSVPMILYNVPGRTGSYLAPETTLRLAQEFNNISAIKEASGQWEGIMQIIHSKPDNFTVLSGDDGITLPLQSIGVEGVISVIANALPHQMSEMVRLASSGRFGSARELHYQMFTLFSDLFEEGNPAGVKAALDSLGIAKPFVRLPLTEASQGLYQRIQQEIGKII